MENSIFAFIFDLDGVLTNTSEYHYLAWKKLADELKVPFDREKNESFKGVSRRDCLLLLLNGRQIKSREFNKLLNRKNNYYREYLKYVTPKSLFPGVLELFKKIKAEKGKIAIASVSKNAKEIVSKLGIEEVIDLILDGYSVEYPKPAPDQFLHAALMLRIPPEKCIVFEDAVAGIEAAKRANMFAVGIGDKIILNRADIVYSDISEVDMNYLKEQICKKTN